MDARDLLSLIDVGLSRALERGLGTGGVVLSLDGFDTADRELAEIAARIGRAFDMVGESYRFAEALARGDIQASASRRNTFAMPLKALQASLAHLTWQTNQVADGDLSQKVQFLGEFSRSFNRMIEALREKAVLEQRLNTITAVLGTGVYLVDQEGCLVYLNPEGEALLEYRFDELEGTPIHAVIHRQHPDGTQFPPESSELARAIRTGSDYNSYEVAFTCKSGRLLPVSIACRPVMTGGRPGGAVVAFRDHTEQRRYQDSLRTINDLLERQATTDSLTGISNRLKLNQILRAEMERARRYGAPLAVVLFDIDRFKSINDTFGHLQGDAVLKEIATLVSAGMRATDVVARWGGEEFMIVVPGCDLEHAVQFAEVLREKVAGHPFPVPRPVTASFGVAAFEAGDTEVTLTNRADSALYRSKQRGRNRVECGPTAPRVA